MFKGLFIWARRDIYRPQRSCGQGNIFTGVCLSTGGGGCLPQCMLGCHTPQMENPPGRWRTPPGWRTPPREADSSIRSTSGRYASYWNAYLCIERVVSAVVPGHTNMDNFRVCIESEKSGTCFEVNKLASHLS